MAIQSVRRTYRASVRNHAQVTDELDTLGVAGSKLWNVGRWTVARVWDGCGKIPSGFDLQKYLKTHERYGDLHSQSSQQVLAELGEAFESWYGHRTQGNEQANPPGYRKRGDEHPRSTITFKKAVFKHDEKHGYLRLSKGGNLKAHRYDYVLCNYETRPDVDLSAASVSIQQVRAVWSGEEWELLIVCDVDKHVPDSPGERTAGVDLGICNLATVSFGDEAVLYPGGTLKEDQHYFTQIEYDCEGKNGLSNTARWGKRSLKRRRRHFLHVLSKDIITQCVDRNVGRLRVGDLSGIRSKATVRDVTGEDMVINDSTTGRSRNSSACSNTKVKRLESMCLSDQNATPPKRVLCVDTSTVTNASTEASTTVPNVVGRPTLT